MSFFDQVGKMALGSRVRLLAEKISDDAASIYEVYGTKLQPKWFPVFYLLSQAKEKTATAIAEEIGHSHASVSKILAEMAAAGLILEKIDTADRRRVRLSLSRQGRAIARKITAQYTDVHAAISEITSETTHDLWAALEEWENLLVRKSIYERVLESKRRRESAQIAIESYRPEHAAAFRKLNYEWITTYFKIEKPDREVLNNPQKYILDRGGFIFVATMNKKPVGVCALMKKEKNVYELAKMAVAVDARGKNVGVRLGEAVIEKARVLKANRIFLESNTILKPAIGLYRKLGFKKIVGPPSPYARCNIQMELGL